MVERHPDYPVLWGRTEKMDQVNFLEERCPGLQVEIRQDLFCQKGE